MCCIKALFSLRSGVPYLETARSLQNQPVIVELLPFMDVLLKF